MSGWRIVIAVTRARHRDGSAWLVGDCEHHVLRGGSWNYLPMGLSSAGRGWNSAGDRLNSVGFRVAQTLAP